jgi:hypothetical protein
LKVGTIVDTEDGKGLMVARVEPHHRAGGYTVYNFEVEGDHTYFVGQAHGGVWVHNDCTDEAARIIKKLGDGEVWRVNGPRGGFGIKGVWNEYHDIVINNEGNVIDTLTYRGSEDPVPLDQWKRDFDIFTDGNGNQFDRYLTLSAGSGSPIRFARLMGQ